MKALAELRSPVSFLSKPNIKLTFFRAVSQCTLYFRDGERKRLSAQFYQINIVQYVFFTDLYRKTISMESSCSTFLLVSGVLGGLLFISAFLMCYLASRLQTALATRYHSNNLDQFVRDHSRKCSMSETYGYTGRSTIQ